MPKKTTWERFDSRPLQSGGHSNGDNAPQKVVITSETGTPFLVERGSTEHTEFIQRLLAKNAKRAEQLQDKNN